MITPKQLGKLWVLLKETGRDRETAHQFLAFETARPIESSKQLTRQEASMVIQVLEHEINQTAGTRR